MRSDMMKKGINRISTRVSVIADGTITYFAREE